MKAGWEPEHKDYFSVVNVLCIIILLGTAWATCATWFQGPYLLACVGVVWASLIFIFFKNPVATFVIAISLVVAVVAFPQPLSRSLSFPPSAPSSSPSPPLPTPQPQTDYQKPHEYSRKEWESDKQPQTSDWPKNSNPPSPSPTPSPPIEPQHKYNPPIETKPIEPKKPAEPQPLSRDDIILGPGVEVASGSKPTITLSGGGMICEGSSPTVPLLFTMTGNGPWQFSYFLEGTDEVKFTTSSTPTHKVFVDKPGVYKLSKTGEDAVCELYDVHGEAVVTFQKKPLVEFITPNVEICEGDTGKLEAALRGTPPWTVTYDDGEKISTQVVTSSPIRWQSYKDVTYTITSVQDKFCINDNLQERASVKVISLPSISLEGGRCIGDDVLIRATGTPPFFVELDNPPQNFTLSDHTLSFPTRSLSSSSSSSSSSSFSLSEERLMFRLRRDALCSVSTSIVFAELHKLPTAEFMEVSKIAKAGEKVAMEVVLTGRPPWDLWYTTPTGLKTAHIRQSPHILSHHEEGKYALVNVSDTYCKNSVKTGKTELTVFTFSPPSVTVSPLNTLCEGTTAYINIEFVGKPPFTYHYSFNGKRYTKHTPSSTEIFSTTEHGIFKLEEFSDFFNYTVKPDTLVVREVKFSSPPSYSVRAPPYSCDNAPVDVVISISGQGPFNVQYMLNQTTFSKDEIEGRFTFPTPTPTLITLSHVRDRYGCDAQLSDDGLHIPSKSLPYLEVFGGDCSPISLQFQGVPPFKLDYKFTGLPNRVAVTKSGVEFIDYSTQFTEPGTYQFVAISDSYCQVQFTNNVRTILQPPTAELDLARTHFKLCEIEPKSPKEEQVEVKLSGAPPFDIVISTPEGNVELHNIVTHSVSVPVTKGGDYEIVKVSDSNCRGSAADVNNKKTVIMEYYPTPTVAISGGGQICQGDSVDLRFDMTGTGPWTVECSNGKHSFSFESKARSYTHHLQTAEYSAPQEKSGTYRITNFIDSNCKGPIGGSVDVVIHPIPTARIQGGGVVCAGEETTLKLSLTGTPPWSLSISRNTSDIKIPMKDVMKSQVEVKADEPAFFYVDFIQDKHCKYTRTSVPRPPR